jgi:hypothetical protein
MATTGSANNKVVVWWSNDNLAIESIAKFLLEQGWFPVQSWLSATVSLNFILQTAWKFNFECTFLQILHNNHANSLKQSYSPKIDLHSWCGDLGQILNNLEDVELQKLSQYHWKSDLIIWEKVWLFAYKPKT